MYDWIDSDKSNWVRHVIVQEVAWFGNKKQFIHYVGFTLVGLVMVLLIIDAIPIMINNNEAKDKVNEGNNADSKDE